MIPIVSFSIVSIDSVIGYRIFFGFKVEANKKKKKKKILLKSEKVKKQEIIATCRSFIRYSQSSDL